jgi:predicted PurR-regulated permease PerM
LQEGKTYTFDRVVRILFTAAVIFGLILLARYLSDVLLPFAIAVLLAYLLNPLVRLIQKKVTNRSAAVLLSLAVVALFLAVLGALVVPMITAEMTQMGKIVSRIVSNSDLAARAAELLPGGVWESIKDYLARDEVQGFFKSKDFWQMLANAARKVLPGAWGVLTGTATFLLGLFGLVVILIYLLFVLIDYERISRGWSNLIPFPYRDAVREFLSEFEGAMTRYFRGQALISAICAVLMCIGFVLIGLPLGILLGLVMGLLNMIPYLQLLGVIPALLLALFKALEAGSDIWTAMALTAAVLAGVQVIQDWILAPKIMGKVTGLNPAFILLSLTIWGKILGFLGLIVALPMTCLVLAYYRRFLVSTEAESVSRRLPA